MKNTIIQCFLSLLLLSFSVVSYAESELTTELIEPSQQRLFDEQRSYQAAEIFLKNLQQQRQELALTLHASDVDNETLTQAEFELELLQSNLVTTQLSLQYANQELSVISSMISFLSDSDTEETQQQLVEWEALQQSTLIYIDNIQDIQQATSDHIKAQNEWLIYLKQLYLLKQQQDYQQILKNLQLQSTTRQNQLLVIINTLNHELSTTNLDKQDLLYSSRLALEVALFESTERDYLNRVNLNLLALDKRLELLVNRPFANQNMFNSVGTKQQIDLLSNQLTYVNTMLKQRMDIITDRLTLLSNQQGAKNISQIVLQNLDEDLSQLLIDIRQQLEVIADIKTITDNYVKQLASLIQRQSFRDASIFNPSSWESLWSEIMFIPAFTWQYTNNVYLIVQEKLKTIPINGWFILFLISGAFYLLWWRGKKMLAKSLSYLKTKEKYFANTIILMVLTIIYRHILALAFLGWLAVIIFVLEIDLASIGLPVYLVMVWLIFKSIIDVARLYLLENVSDVAGQDVRLYRSLKWLFGFAGFVTAIAVIARELSFSPIFLDFLLRIIMLFLAIVGVILVRWWRVIPNLLAEHLRKSRAYVRRVVYILSLSTPLIIFANALIGLLADAALLKELFIYQGIFLLVLTSYIVMRGLIKDLFEIISESLIRYVKNGWLWSNMLLRPMDSLARIGLFLGSLYLLFISYGGTADSEVAVTLSYVLVEPLFIIGEKPFNMMDFIFITVSIFFILWSAKWSRELAYRWIYANTRDLGLRNSLAAFTQYMTVLLIIMMLLAALGFDAYSLSLIFAGLMVPIGFGMRDLANNFVSGILLLIERPLRKGDRVSVAEHNGEVIHIGMRSITVRTFDNMEVIVPNADIFYKPFINWTLQDDIVRLISTIRIERTEDPYRAQALILKILNDKIPAIVNEPPSQVLFMEMDDGFIVFDLRYFMDLRIDNSRDRVRSQVMFNVWEAFKQHGILFPYPRKDININDKT